MREGQANSETAQPADFVITVLPEQFGWAKGSDVTLMPTKDSLPLLRCQKMDAFQGALPGFAWSAYGVTRQWANRQRG